MSNNNNKVFYKNGDLKYEGELINGRIMHGSGIYYSENGQKYIGEFKNNKKHGYGIEYYSNGDIYQGKWIDDKFINDGLYYCASLNVKMKTNIKI